MKTLSISILPALLFALLTCSPPPFNLAISDLTNTAKKLNFVGQVGPMNPGSLNISSRGNKDVVFFPEKDGMGSITLEAGFVYSMDPFSGQQVSFVSRIGGQYAVYGGSLPLGPVSTDPFPNAVLQSVKSIHNGIAFKFDDITPANSTYSIATGTTSPGSFVASTGPVSLNSTALVGAGTAFGPATKEIIGLSTYPDQSASFDRTYWLIRSQGTNHFREGLFDISQNQIPAGSGVQLRAGFYDLSPFVRNFSVAGSTRVLYYFDPNTSRGYASVWNSPLSPGNWSTWVWIDNIPTYSQLSSVSNRIDDLLTTGELFSTQGNVCNVYDPTTSTGTLETTFPLDDLRFIGEVYMGGTPTVLFSQALWYNQKVSFNIYSIPTSQLKSLGN